MNTDLNVELNYFQVRDKGRYIDLKITDTPARGYFFGYLVYRI